MPAVLFGGPDKPPRILRQTLQRLIDAAPAGSRIDWATYYFRDRALAEALIRASDRGVAVTLAVEPRPRLAGANDAVLAMLGKHGLNGGFRPRSRWRGLGQLHAKVYAFSAPDLALVGSFNPSGDDPEDAAVIAGIGDQDRGWNLLLGLRDPALTAALRDHIALLATTSASPLDRLRPGRGFASADGTTRVLAFPRADTRPVERDIAALSAGDRVEAAISHMKPGPLATALRRAARSGAEVRLLVHATERRVPTPLVDRLARAGIAVARAGNGTHAPMHNKFVLIDRAGGRRHAWLGSYNYNPKSRWLNDELLVRTTDRTALALLTERFAEMWVAVG